MTSHLPAIRGIFDLRYQDLAVNDYSCGLDALLERSGNPVIGGPACPVKCEAYFTGAVSSTFETLGLSERPDPGLSDVD